MSLPDTYNAPLDATPGLKAWLLISGLAAIALGAAAILFPFAAALAAELVFGAVLAASGLFHIGRAMFVRGVESPVWTSLYGALSLVAGAILLLYPLQGVLTLTVVVATFLILGGIAKMAGAWRMSPGQRLTNGLPQIRGWGWMALSGALSVLLGAILFLGLPISAMWALGLLIGLDLLFLGAAEIALALALFSGPDTAEERT